MNLHLIACEEFLRKMAVPEYKNTYALGLFGRRVTIRSQQVRGLNLIRSLLATTEIGKGSKILVVGAGFAGLTAAAAAIQAKCEVTVLDRAQTRLSLQRNCRHRFLHPHVYGWPSSDYANPDAGLPLLNWTADLAENVVKQVDSQIAIFGSAGLREVFGVESITVLPNGTAMWRQANSNVTNAYDAIVMAIGFGVEKTEAGTVGYWDDFPLDANDSSDKNVKILISGSGDGALTDLMRACLLNFRQDQLLTQFASAPSMKASVDQINEIEASLESGNAAFLSERYQDSRLDLGLSLVRRKCSVYWAPGSDHMFTPNSSALNRFVVAQLFHAGAFEPLVMHGRTEKVDRLPQGGFAVTFSTGYSDEFHVLVQRHGPISGLKKDFPHLANACERLRENWSSLSTDWTDDILPEGGDTGRVVGGKITPAVDPVHAADIDAALISGYKLSGVASRETVFVVVGSGLWQDLLDRPTAQVAQIAVNSIGKTRLRRAIILSDNAWNITPEAHSNPVISIGGPNVNRLTDQLKDDNRYALESGVFGTWKLHLGMPQVALWGGSPQETLRAVEEYVRRPAGLAAFLGQSWK
jgi:alanine dehydrogenase/PNT-like protein